MADTIREKIIADIVSTLEGYASYSLLSSPSILRGVKYLDPSVNPVPIISVLAGKEEATVDTYDGEQGQTTLEMPLTVATLVKFPVDKPSETAEAAFGELISAVLSSVPSNADSIYLYWRWPRISRKP